MRRQSDEPKVQVWSRLSFTLTKKHYAGRGYAYVGCSRFRSQAGCHLYGVLRQSDFLHVGPDRDDEHWERGYDSLDSSDSEYEDEGEVGGMFIDEDEDAETEYDGEELDGNELNTCDPDGAAMYNPADFGMM